MNIDDQLELVINNLVQQIKETILTTAADRINTEINHRLSSIDLSATVNAIVNNQLKEILSDARFPEKSINHNAIDFSNIRLTGDMISGGIIENFGSKGIEDRASFVQLTLMDHATVFEGPIYTPEIQAKGDSIIDGNLTISGNLIIAGDIPTDSKVFKTIINYTSEQTQELLKESLSDEWLSDYSRIIFDEIKETGLDLSRITQNGREIIKDNQLGYHITDTNIQRLGHVVDLQTRGETLLSDTFYVTKNRAGVNTLDPSAAFVVWDEECEIVVAKRKSDTGYIGTSRNQNVILGSNNKENIVLGTDGSTVISQLTLNKVSMTSSNEMPTHNAPRGNVVFNESPDIGQYMGWVSLGGARWASFGKIE